jgi:predicted nucleic acid-binding protein
VTLIDAYGLVALMTDEPAAAEVEELLRDGDCRVVVVNLAEAVDVAIRSRDLPSEAVRDVLEPMTLSGVLGVSLSKEREAWLAAELRLRHYHRKRSPLSMADCLLLAHALADEDAVATADPDLAAAARKEGVTVISLS